MSQPPRVALIACGALGREVGELARARGWRVDVYGVPALHHLYPGRIVEAVEARLRQVAGRYDRVIAVYGDCGTAGALDAVLARHGAARLAGPHCYEMFAGRELFRRVSEEQPGTFFLTDWLVRAFHRAVVVGLGLDRHPELRDLYFHNYTGLLYLRQRPDPGLLARAEAIADFLGLPLEVRDVGLGELEHRLAALVEAPAA